MAFTAITYTFSNSTTADATQVNQNFTDLVNGLSDGTKDISVNAGTFAGNVSISGNTTIGNASGDDLTVTASLASSIPIKTTNSYDIGSSTLGLRALYFGANSQTVKIQGSSSMSATWTMTLPVSAGTDGYFLKTNGSGVTSWSAFTPPTVQRFTSGSGTYTTPANVKYIRVTMCGGGGGGGGTGTGSLGTVNNGGNSTFGSSLLTAGLGSGGDWSGGTAVGGVGGTNTINSPATAIINLAGGRGQGSPVASSSGAISMGGQGGNNAFGGAGGGGYAGLQAGQEAATNSGGGGGGAGTTTSIAGGGGGGAGGYLVAQIDAPSSTYAYSVGGGGAGQSAGTSGVAGGNGGSGVIIVEEYYQ